MAEGLSTTAIDLVTIADEVIVNRNGSTGRMPINDLSNQVAGLVQPGLSEDMETLAGPYVAAANSARLQSEAARDLSIAGAAEWPTAAAGVGRGVQGILITAGGAGGTNGTATWVASGGVAVIPATGTATIVGGVVVAVAVRQRGHYTTDPTGITLTGHGALAGQSFALTIGVNTPVDGYFKVPSTSLGEAAIVYKNAAGVAVEQYRTSSSLINTYVAEPFPPTDWAEPVSLSITTSPSSGLTATMQQYAIAAAGRFYAVPTIASLGLVIGDTVRVAFRRVSGAAQPVDMTFRAGLTLVATVPFALVNGWYIAEAVIPATTTIIRLDYTNATGAGVTISRPRFAKKGALRDLAEPTRTRIAALIADAGEVPNLWTGAVGKTKFSGAALIGDVILNADGTMTIPADIFVAFNAASGTVTRPNGAVMTIRSACRRRC